jgi:addiction module HigA family antidote
MNPRPPHPGELVRDHMEDAGLTLRGLARALHVTPSTVGNILRRRSGISAEMAIRLSVVFAPSPDFWMLMQLQHDLARAEKAFGRRIRADLKPIAARADG